MIDPQDGFLLFGNLLTTLPRLHSSVPLLPQAFSIASAVRIPFYDCLYVALADREQCELLTADTKLVNALQKQYPFVVHLSVLP